MTPGQPVRARLHAAPGHTRLPLYVRGRAGTVHALRGHFPLPDELARTGMADPQPLYSVRFAARDLWGDQAGDHDVYLDLFEPWWCTLCSCYPVSLLGPSPPWYKSFEYRSRAVREPRAVLEEFGVRLDPEVRLNVWDSNADCRYLVLPHRPEGTDHLTEDQLVELIPRDALVGAALVTASADTSETPA